MNSVEWLTAESYSTTEDGGRKTGDGRVQSAERRMQNDDENAARNGGRAMTMNCEAACQLLSRALDGELPVSDEAELRDHLAQCPTCTKEEKVQRRLMAAARSLKAPSPPHGYEGRLRSAVWKELDGARRAPSLSFRILALAAVLLLSVAVAYLAHQLNESRKQILHLRADQARRPPPRVEDLPLVSVASLRNPGVDRGIAEQVQAFSAVQDYFGGVVRWMAVDDNQVEIGMSGSARPKVNGAGSAAQAIVLTFEYLERLKSGKTVVLSNPQFVLLPGEEASVRLRSRDAGSEELFRYRTKASVAADGQIHGTVTFVREMGEAGSGQAEIDSPVIASIVVRERAPVLIGATGDDSARRELYVMAALQPIRRAEKSVPAGGDHL